MIIAKQVIAIIKVIQFNLGVSMSNQGSGGNVLAAICNFFIPGLGQLVQGRILPALFFFIGMAVSWALVWILIGWILVPIVYLWAIIDAARYKGGS
ncbi:MAG: TM2 domain-containing membrane protein YozV [Colwellia sp.]|jgi:TM2 domain-containing membrane protein YozV